MQNSLRYNTQRKIWEESANYLKLMVVLKMVMEATESIISYP